MQHTDTDNEVTSGTGVSEHRRRSNKPIMEKKRRARINNCLNELKSLLLEAMRKDPARHSKLEKADILEMTVKHLQNMQRMRRQLAVSAAAAAMAASNAGLNTSESIVAKYRAGFRECATEVARYVNRIDNDGMESRVKQRLLTHLAHYLDRPAPTSNGCGGGMTMPASTTISAMAAARSAAQLRLLLPPRPPPLVDWNRLCVNVRPASSTSSGYRSDVAAIRPSEVKHRSVIDDQSPCSSSSSRSDDGSSEDVVCLNDDDDDVGHMKSNDPAADRVNLSIDVEKMWRPW